LAVTAVQQIRRMRGGAQSQLMLGADENLYVVKFQNNPQHSRVLANELLATRLAEAVGLTVPACEVIEVSEWLIAHSPELDMEMARTREACAPGLQFGSRFVGGLMPGHVVDYLAEELLLEVKNLNEFPGMLALDKWTGNTNGRQAVYSKRLREKRYLATFVDQGYCFNAGEWKFADAPLRGVFPRNAVYQEVTGWESLEPWLGRIESMSAERIWSIAETVPPEWYGGDVGAIERLVQQLLERRSRVRELVGEFRESSRAPFPKWVRQEGKAEEKELAALALADDLRGDGLSGGDPGSEDPGSADLHGEGVRRSEKLRRSKGADISLVLGVAGRPH
jgi:hypothetical protein